VADNFTITGSYTSKPASVGTSSGAATIAAPLEVAVQLQRRTEVELVLDSDSPVAVSIPSASAINAVVLTTVGGKVRARFTSSDGSTQAVPVDPLAVVVSESVDITALDITRVAGQETRVRVFLGERVS